MPKKVTLQDISRRAGVSPATVSNVLNGRKERVSSVTARAVLQAAAELGYPQRRPRRDTGRAGTLGIVCASLSAPLFTDALASAEAAASRFGYNLLLASNRGREDRELPSTRQLVEREIEGIIFISSSSYRLQDGLDCAVSANIPAVVVNRLTDSDKALHLLADNEQGAYDATVHLLELGHRDIACIHLPVEGPKATLAGEERLRGFLRALSEYGVAAREEWIRPGVLGAGAATNVGYQVMHDLLSGSPRPTAVFCGTDQLAIGAMHAALDLGLRIPNDLAIVGHDDTVAATYVRPQLTSVRQPMEALGTRAVEALVRHLWTGAALGGAERHPCQLVVRASTVG